jgi:peptidoglycan/LPS O-acetylase OafA/YrhL
LVAALIGWFLLATDLDFNREAAILTKSSWLGAQLAREPNLLAALQEGTFGSLIGPWPYASSYNSSLWIMPIEFAGSLALIGVVSATRRFGFRRGAFLARGVALLLAALLVYPLYISLMLAGAAIYFLDIRRTMGPAQPAVVVSLLALSLLLGTVPFSEARGAWWDALVALVPTAFHSLDLKGPGPAFRSMSAPTALHAAGAIVMLLAVERGVGLQKALSRPALRFLGKISFPLYLLHVPLLLSVGCGVFLFAVESGLPFSWSVPVACGAYVGSALLAATIATRLVERPAIYLSGFAGQSAQRKADLVAALVSRTRSSRNRQGDCRTAR